MGQGLDLKLLAITLTLLGAADVMPAADGNAGQPHVAPHPSRLRCRLQYATSYLLTDVLACLPINCIMVLANSSLNYYNTGELIK
jgi:hypothetical protein